MAVMIAGAALGADVDEGKIPPPASAVDFAADIQPLLEGSCVRCHGAEKQKGKFRLDTRSGLLAGGENGKAIIVGTSLKSPLIHYVTRLVEDLEMPPKKEAALSPGQIGLLRTWIDQGAAWPDGLVLHPAAAEAGAPDPARLAALPPAAARSIDFIADVQPIFAKQCYQCHGPKRQEAGFRLDHKPTVLHGGDLGAAIIPGRSADSLLIHLVGGLRDEVMPKEGPRLTAEQIGVLRAWIDQGAPFPDSASVVLRDPHEHWAFKPVQRPAIPAVQLAAWVRNPIDAFVLARLEKESLAPSPEADRTTLLRRLSLDLIGLPPTIAEVDAFIADADADAYQKQVDRLLASPHYGERWGRHWLDAARYADSDGYEKDKPRSVYFYRDWVIDSFNRDLPYSDFIIDQLAGDQLPGASQDQIVATGFLRNSMINEEGGVDPEQFRMEAMFDRMETVGRSMLGLTIQCAQCHNHKYDPITQEDYYRLFAFLNNDNDAQPLVYTRDEQAAGAEVQRLIREREAALKSESPGWQERMDAWEDEVGKRVQPQWTVIQPVVEDISTGGQRYLPQADGSFITAGYQPTKHEALLTITTEVQGITAFRLEVMADAGLPAQGPGRSHLGTFALTEFKVEAAPAHDVAKRSAVAFASAISDLEPAPDTPVRPEFNEKEPVHRVIGPARYAIDGNAETAWSNDVGPGRSNRDCFAIFVAAKPIANPGGSALTIKLAQNHGGWNSDDLQAENLGRFRLAITTAADPASDNLPRYVRDILACPRGQRSPEQAAALFSYWRTTVTAWNHANEAIDALWRRYPEGTTQLTLTQRQAPRATRLLKRGDWLKPSRIVTAAVPAFLNALPTDAPPTRLTLAKWLVDPRTPTTARTFVNNMWQHYFGTGIVGTVEDLGTQCEAPSHPELLDWLASEFTEHGWSIKRMQRLIVTSATYRQSSRITPSLYQRDQFNRLLARASRLRVDGEVVRDIQLSVSGLLNPAIGGRSVMPPAPDFLFKPPASYAPFPWIEESGDQRYRRAIYTYRRRSTPYPMLQAFDTPEGNVACSRRGRSNTPLQALMTLNETLAVEAARALARRMIVEGGMSDAERIGFGFRCCLGRRPTDAERDALLLVMAKQRTRIADGWVDALAVTGLKADALGGLPAGTTPRQVAAFTVAARVLLNLDETITKE
jgi:mono/diheme cytochrome c family protein